MKKSCVTYMFISFIAAVSYSCKKIYMPDVTTENPNILVVEGILNAGNDSTFIKLSRTVMLSQGTGINPEKNAQVSIEAEDGTVYILEEESDGTYVAPPLNFDHLQKHRLRIETGGEEYASDFVETKMTPPIDDLGYVVKGDNVNVIVNTKDAENNTRYYRWEYDQTWEFNATYKSDYKKTEGGIVSRGQYDDIYHCWADTKNSSITLGSSAKLSQDVIKDHIILSIPGNAEKLGIKYSILLKQYALTKDGFDFWQNLKKNAEGLGTIFDPMPSQVKGNIYCVTEPSQIVIGYFSISSVTTKRAFINKSDLMQFKQKPFYTDCKKDTVYLEVADFYYVTEKGPYLPLYEFTKEDETVAGYLSTISRCADCTLRGSKKRPDFWE